MASSPPLIMVRIYNVQTCFEYLSRTKQLSWKQATFKNFGGNFLIFQHFRATFGCIDKQLFLNLPAQSIYASSL